MGTVFEELVRKFELVPLLENGGIETFIRREGAAVHAGRLD
jgi:hypothetical protein